MNKNVKRMLAVSALVISFTLAPVFAQPGTAEDPLVSKKYVDDQVAALRTLINQNAQYPTQQQPVTSPVSAELTNEMRAALVAEALAAYENAYGEMLRQAAANAGSQAMPSQVTQESMALFEVVQVQAGQVVLGDSSTEMILRGGTATVACGVNGLCDVTDGMDLANNTSVPYNHLIIIPVGDGRGFRITTDAYLMIKGRYYFG